MFFEETSLVANPGVSAALCKERLTKRLEFHGIGIEEVEVSELAPKLLMSRCYLGDSVIRLFLPFFAFHIDVQLADPDLP